MENNHTLRAITTQDLEVICSDEVGRYTLPRALDRILQEDWVRDATKDPRVLMSLRVNFGLIG